MTTNERRLRKYRRKKLRARAADKFDKYARLYWRYHWKIHAKHVNLWEI